MKVRVGALLVFEFGEPKASGFKLGRHLRREIGARFDLPRLDIQKFAHGSRRLRLEGELLGRVLEEDPGNLSRGRPARGRGPWLRAPWGRFVS
jgi:hypothetical protein